LSGLQVRRLCPVGTHRAPPARHRAWQSHRGAGPGQRGPSTRPVNAAGQLGRQRGRRPGARPIAWGDSRSQKRGTR